MCLIPCEYESCHHRGQAFDTACNDGACHRGNLFGSPLPVPGFCDSCRKRMTISVGGNTKDEISAGLEDPFEETAQLTKTGKVENSTSLTTTAMTARQVLVDDEEEAAKQARKREWDSTPERETRPLKRARKTNEKNSQVWEHKPSTPPQQHRDEEDEEDEESPPSCPWCEDEGGYLCRFCAEELRVELGGDAMGSSGSSEDDSVECEDW